MSILIDKIYRTNLKFEFKFEYLLGILYTFGYLHLSYFVFAWVYFAILLAEYKFMTRGARNFMEESENQKVVGTH